MPDTTTRNPRASLVESIPLGLESLRGTPGVQYTEDVLVRLTQAAQSTIDLTAMYWALLPDPKGPDEQGFTDEQFQQMGADSGRALNAALYDAAGRGVSIRILQSPGFSGHKQESDDLREHYPKQVSIHEIDMSNWYASGIMHQKIWIFDSVHLYLGSANMDWKSLMQVKEMGVAVEDCPELATDAIKYFDSWWAFSALSPTNQEAFDPAVRINRRVPSWSSLIGPSKRSQSPLADRYATEYSARTPVPLALNGEQCGVFLSGCPQEVLGKGRTWDGEGLVHTIDDAQKSVCISVMDFAPAGLYSRPSMGPPIADEGHHSDRHSGLVASAGGCSSIGSPDSQTVRSAARQQVGSYLRTDRAYVESATECRGCGSGGHLHELWTAGDQTLHGARMEQHERQQP